MIYDSGAETHFWHLCLSDFAVIKCCEVRSKPLLGDIMPVGCLIMFIQIYYCYYKWLVMLVLYCRFTHSHMDELDWSGFFEIRIERQRKTDTCLSGHMSTSKTNICWSTEERHLLTFCISSLFNCPEKNNDCWNKHGSPPKSKGWDREWENISLTFNTLRNDGIWVRYGVR